MQLDSSNGGRKANMYRELQKGSLMSEVQGRFNKYEKMNVVVDASDATSDQAAWKDANHRRKTIRENTEIETNQLMLAIF